MAGHASTTGTRPSELADAPPSAKLVAKTLEYEGDLTQSALADATRLPPRTVRYALRDLESDELVDSRMSFADARKRIYSLSDDISQPSGSVD